MREVPSYLFRFIKSIRILSETQNKYFHMRVLQRTFDCQCLERFLPHEKANRTRMKSVMNLRISITIRLSDTCNGPKYGLTEKMQTSFKLEKILAAAKRPSEISMGSQVSQCSRFKWAAGLPVRSSSCTLKIMGSRNVNQLQKFNFLKLLWCP